MSKESLSELIDRIRYTILKAPDRFPADTGMNLSISFARLREHLEESKAEVGNLFSQMQSLLSEAQKSYSSGDTKTGIRHLQAIDSLIRSPNQSIKRDALKRAPYVRR